MTQGHQGRANPETPALPLDGGEFQESASTPSLTTRSGTPQGRAGTPYESTVRPSDSAVSAAIRPNTEVRDGQGRQIQKVHVRAGARMEPVSGRDVHDRPCVPDQPVSEWLADIKQRDIQINAAGPTPTLRGAAVTDTDIRHATRHAHTLQLAAAGTHPTWWQWATGRDRTTAPDWDDIPWTCGTCGTDDIVELDPDLVAWCQPHAPARQEAA